MQLRVKQPLHRAKDNACHKEGAVPSITHLTCLTDGANNCWSIAEALKPVCHTLTMILDWFHITKRFTVLSNVVDENYLERLEKVKWHLWHGNGKAALERLATLITDITNESLLERLENLYQYIESNLGYLVNHQVRQAAGLHFTSTLAEVTVNCLINTRQKRNQKMQWTREGAHDVLQIRTSLFSKSWKQDWSDVQPMIYKEAA